MENRLAPYWSLRTEKESKGSKAIGGFHGAVQPGVGGDNFISEAP